MRLTSARSYGYVALIYDETRQSEARNAAAMKARLLAITRWSSLVDAPGIAVLECASRNPTLRGKALRGAHGAVLGRMFLQNADISPAVQNLDEDESRVIVASRGGHLLRRYWGGYVAIVRDSPNRRTYVFRDPSGNLPCLRLQHGGVHVVLSRPTDVLELGLRAPPVNYVRLVESLRGRDLLLRSPCLDEFVEVHPGERIEVAGAAVRTELIWSPRAIAMAPSTASLQTLIANVRSTIWSCVRAQALCHRGVLHTLSGGLDSSIVAACLRDTEPQTRTVCINYVTAGSEGDERAFARAVTTRARLDLIEYQLQPNAALMARVLDVEPGSRPHSYRYHLEHAPIEAEIASAHGLGVIFSGGGGDGLFGRSLARLAVADTLCASFRPARLWKTAWDAARIEDRSIWSMLVEGLLPARHCDGRQVHADVTATSFLTAYSRSAPCAAVPHPWIEDSRSLPPGKRLHVAMTCVPPFFYDPLAGPNHPERVHPLVCQPIIELFLRTPTCRLIQNGWDRSLVRQAFVDDLPPEIVRRRSKGRVGEHTRELILANLPFVRETLCGGLLVRERLLDPQRLEQAFRKRSAMTALECSALEEFLSVEAWVRKWVALRAQGSARTTL